MGPVSPTKPALWDRLGRTRRIRVDVIDNSGGRAEVRCEVTMVNSIAKKRTFTEALKGSRAEYSNSLSILQNEKRTQRSHQ